MEKDNLRDREYVAKITKEPSVNKALLFLLDAILGIVFVILDRITKNAAVDHLKNQQPIAIVKKVLSLFYLENYGSAFGILEHKKIIILFVSIFFMILLLFMAIKVPAQKKYNILHFCVTLIVAGGIGNMIDRMSYGYVVDFIYFELINFPVFNVADIFVVIGTFLMGFLLLFYYKEEDLKFMEVRKKHENK